MLRKRGRGEQEASHSEERIVKKGRSLEESSHATGVGLRLEEFEPPLVPVMQEREIGVLARRSTQRVRSARASLNFSALPQRDEPASDPTPMVLPSSPQINRPAAMFIPEAAIVLPDSALFNPPPEEADRAESSQPEVVRSSKDEVDSGTVMRAVLEGTPKKDEYGSPLKLHGKAMYKGDKPSGINEGYIGYTPSKRTDYMVKPEVPKSRIKTVIEYIMGGVYQKTVDPNRVPRVQLSRHISRTLSSVDRPKFSVLSPMIDGFTPLKNISNSGAEKPVYFEKLLLTSMLAGNPDGHNQNLGFDKNGALVQIDFDRCLAVQFKNGWELLQFMQSFCEYRGYFYKLSFAEMISHISNIQKIGSEAILTSIKVRLDHLLQLGYEISNEKPLSFWKYKAESFCSDALVRQKQYTYTSLTSFYDEYVVKLITSNFNALVEVSGILTRASMFKSIDSIQIKNTKAVASGELCVSFSDLLSKTQPEEVYLDPQKTKSQQLVSLL